MMTNEESYPCFKDYLEMFVVKVICCKEGQ